MKKRFLGLLLVVLFGVFLVACDELDLVAPVISGVADHEIMLGDEKPDYLLNVSAFDEVDKDVEVTVDDSNVDLTKPGKYTIVFSAVDKAGNRSFEIKTVTVTGEAGIQFIGTKDHTVVIGTVWPDFSEGVKAVDGNGDEYDVVVDSASVKTDQKGQYPIYIKAIDIVGKTLAIQEQTVTVVYKEETQAVADFIRDIDYNHVGIESTHLSVSLGLGDLMTPPALEDGTGPGLLIENMSMDLDVYVNLETYQESIIYAEFSINIEKINLIQYMTDGTINQATGTTPGSDYITNTQLKYGVFITEDKLNVFVESELYIYGTKFSIGNFLGGFMGFMIKETIPADFLPIYEIILPMITDHRESITIEYNQEKYYEAVGIIMMAKSFLLNLEMEQAINQELWPVSISDGILTVDNIGLFTINNLEFAMILPILEMMLGSMELSPFVQTILNSTVDVTLSTEDNKFSELQFDFNGIDLGISLNTKDVLLPVIPSLEDVMDPDNPESVLIPRFEEVESLTIVDTIIELIGYLMMPELPPVEEA